MSIRRRANLIRRRCDLQLDEVERRDDESSAARVSQRSRSDGNGSVMRDVSSTSNAFSVSEIMQ